MFYPNNYKFSYVFAVSTTFFLSFKIPKNKPSRIFFIINKVL
ncbi:hypothetical protein AAJ76_460008950 [Vairimorpha ceranae]|uniref:Uncharacterized protein n=1 Tax=Vairimorpha ceranae TaxID=40302 RepID=A0A0F9YQ30_9MICR|nr:hypothetical protein AAJ76_460008950 [Vairimorpha ceranae]KKO74767.1 hypothetical protein AAJ76_460008950 [Vairimorpha ceranae]